MVPYMEPKCNKNCVSNLLLNWAYLGDLRQL
nr:MAG TPA: hypothetical protein [Caudoviricetes sp.]